MSHDTYRRFMDISTVVLFLGVAAMLVGVAVGLVTG